MDNRVPWAPPTSSPLWQARGEEHGRPPVAAIPGSTGTGSIGACPRGGARWGFGMNKLQFGFSPCVDCWIIRYWAPPLCKHELASLLLNFILGRLPHAQGSIFYQGLLRGRACCMTISRGTTTRFIMGGRDTVACVCLSVTCCPNCNLGINLYKNSFACIIDGHGTVFYLPVGVSAPYGSWIHHTMYKL